MTDKVTLLVNGSVFSGWENVRITRAIQAISGSFSLKITDRWKTGAASWQIKPLDSCKVAINGQIVITGYIDSVRNGIETNSRTIDVSGRDKTCDLVDCSYDSEKTEFINVNLEKFAREVCRPFGITVTNLVGSLNVVEKLSHNPGETYFEMLNRAAKLAGVLLMSDSIGGIYITRAGTERLSTAIIEGINFLKGSVNLDFSKRFSSYKALGQNTFSGVDEDPGFSSQVSVTASDSMVHRYRPCVIMVESNANIGNAKMRAQWEASSRAANSSQVSVDVPSWSMKNGNIWPLNKIVFFESKKLGFSGNLLIGSQTFSQSIDDGTKVSLELFREDAFTPEPILSSDSDNLTKLIQEDSND